MDVAVATAPAMDAPRGWRHARAAALVLAIVALTATAAALGASAPGDNAAMRALLRGAMVAAPLGVALYAASIPAYRRFGRLLAVLGLVSFVTTLGESPAAGPYSVGRIAGWGVEILLVVVLLTYPDGRLTARADRRLVAATVGTLVVFYLPTILIAEHFRVPSPYTSCTRDCPVNAFFAGGQDHPGLDAALIGGGSLLVFAIMLGVLVRLQHRVARAAPLERQMLVPVLAVGMVRTTLVGVTIVARDLGGVVSVARVSAWLIAWATPAVAVAFLVGVVRSRLFGERALRRLAMCVRQRPDVPALDRAFAEAFDDPAVCIVFPRPARAGWMDRRGQPFGAAELGGRRTLHVIHGRGGAAVAALVCDPVLAERPELFEAAGDLTAVALDNLRLAAEAEVSAHEANASRARIAAAADRERRRIERDLHDGAQQRLVALRIELSLVEELTRRDPVRCAARIRELEAEVEEALEELRALAHGVCPPLLADRGLAEALRAAASRSTVPVSLECVGVARYTPELESAVYFSVLEALQNVAKHAQGARRVAVCLTGRGPGELSFGVRDDGAGAPEHELHGGAGLTNMHDRIAAVGGELRVFSRPGAGTEVRGRVPALGRESGPRSLAAQGR